MLPNLLPELLAARQISRQIVQAARDPLAPSPASADSTRTRSVPTGTPDVTTQVDTETGLTTFDAIFDGDFFDSDATFA